MAMRRWLAEQRLTERWGGLSQGAGPSVLQYSQKKLKWEPLHPGECRLLSVNSRIFFPLRAASFDGWHLVRFFSARSYKQKQHWATQQQISCFEPPKQKTQERSLPCQAVSLNSSILSSFLTLCLTSRKNRVKGMFALVICLIDQRLSPQHYYFMIPCKAVTAEGCKPSPADGNFLDMQINLKLRDS